VTAEGAAALLALLAVGCQPDNPIKIACRDSMDCLGGRSCTNGLCASPPSDMTGDAALPPDDGRRVIAPANCNASSWQPITLASTEQAAALLVGRWIRCGGGDPPSLIVPTEFTADGHWYSLDHQTDGSYTRSMAYQKWGLYRVKAPDAVTLYDAAEDPDADTFAFGLARIHFSLDPFIMQFDPALYTLIP
jgi:hypothetical protein